MKLSPEDVALFYKLYHALIIYFNNKKNILKGLDDPIIGIKKPKQNVE